MKRWGILIAGIFLFFAMFPALIAQAEDELVVTAIHIKGNVKVRTETILDVIESRVGDVYSPATVSSDQYAIFNELGYFQVVPEVEAEPYEGGIKLTFVVLENPPFKGLEIEIVSGPEPVFTEQEIREIFRVEELRGDLPMNLNLITDAITQIENHYIREGHIFASIVDRDISPNGEVRLKINEGVVKSIGVTGNKKTKPHVVLRHVRTKPGDVFSIKKFRRDMERVFNTGLFEDIRFDRTLTEDREVELELQVVETRTGQIGFGVGYSSNDGFLATVTYAERNLRGSGQRISANGQVGGPDPDVLVSFTNPYLTRDGSSMTIEAFNRGVSRVERDGDEIITEFDTKQIGGSLGFTKPIGTDLTGLVRFRGNRGEIDVEEGDREELQRKYGLLDGTSMSISTGLIHDTRNLVSDPSKGHRASYQVEFFGEWLGGDYDAIKHEIDFRQYFLLKGPDKQDIDFSINPDTNLKNHVMALRLFGGYTTGDISLSDNFYLGGSTTVRGPERDARFGDRAWLANVEYRFPIMGNLGGVVFSDAGNAYSDDDEFDEQDWLWSAGAGIRFKIPALGLGPLRLDYGYSIQGSERNQIVFGFGHMF